MKIYVVIFVLLYLVRSELIIDNNKKIETIPLPFEGWKNRLPKYDLEIVDIEKSLNIYVKGKIGLYIYDIGSTSIDRFVKNIQEKYEPEVIVIKTTGWAGRSYYMGDGITDRKKLYTATVEMVDTDFVYLNNLTKENITGNITFDEINYYQYYADMPMWDILLSFPLCISLLLSIYALRNLYYHWVYKIKFGNPQISLIFLFMENFLRFLLYIDTGKRFFYDYKFVRILYTVHIPFSFVTCALIIIYSCYIIKKTKKGKIARPFMKNKSLKISLIVIVTILFIFEIIGIVGTISSSEYHDMWNFLVGIIYFVIYIMFTILFIVMSSRIISIYGIALCKDSNHADKQVKSKTIRTMKYFVIRSLISGFGYMIYSLSILMLVIIIGIEDDASRILASRYSTHLGIFGLMLSSSVHIYTYTPKSNKVSLVTSYSTSKTKSLSIEINTASKELDTT